MKNTAKEVLNILINKSWRDNFGDFNDKRIISVSEYVGKNGEGIKAVVKIDDKEIEYNWICETKVL